MSMKVTVKKTGEKQEIAEWLYEKRPHLYEVEKPKRTTRKKAENKVVKSDVEVL